MKLPVPYSAFEQACKIAENWQGSYQSLELRYEQLLEKYHQLRVSGASIPEPKSPREVQQVANELPAQVETSIALMSGGNPELDRMLRAAARNRLEKGENAALVARIIEDGEPEMAVTD